MTGIQNSFLDDPIWQKIKADYIEFEQGMKPSYRKKTGSYYTSLDLTLIMLNELIDSLDDTKKQNIHNLTFLEPCVGTGNFVFAYLFLCKKLGLDRNQFSTLLNNIYACDINQGALTIYKKNLLHFAHKFYDIKLDDSYFSQHIADGLLFNLNATEIKYLPLSNNFGINLANRRFDIVATNPPYKNLKAECNQYQSSEAYNLDKKRYNDISKIAKEQLPYSTRGTLNIYKMFVEEITERYLKKDGIGSLLIPASILTDKTCAQLRERILNSSKIHSLTLIPESSNFVDASQALCAMLIEKGKTTDYIRIHGTLTNKSNDIVNAVVHKDDAIDNKMGHTMLILNSNEYNTRKKMCQFPRIKDLNYLHNLRGELDITFDRKYIVKYKQPYKLLRGRNIGYYTLKDDSSEEYVQEAFIETTPKLKYCQQERLVCQQIVNMAKQRRVSFAVVPKNNILANSCNFISIDENSDNVDIYFLLGILNSSFINWFFKLSSSNNHINNYEINEFPIPINYHNKTELSNLVQTYIKKQDNLILEKIDDLVSEAYGLKYRKNKEIIITDNLARKQPSTLLNKFTSDLSHIIPDITADDAKAILTGATSCEYITLSKKPAISAFDKKVACAITEKYQHLASNEILNHITFKLSDLDLEMIKGIPQGGNWQNIPPKTIKKSQRLTTIAKKGGRTTLYGRINYSKPSYTITTFFNRPGNGTYVHPTHDRVLSVREAARFQCFPDSFFFTGNKTNMLKQVGNAVPVTLAYSIGKSIREKTGCHTSVDLFSGAGGMTYGFKLAGIDAVVANDYMESACVTLKANCPEIPVLYGDVTTDDIKDAIINAGAKHQADIICGGPPCQGFSLAGFRSTKDPRNQLFRDFVDIVSEIHPKIVVFENVPGLLSYKNGETYAQIIRLFSELGYNAEGRQIMANEYGAPQKRKRIIIICTRKDLSFTPAEIYPGAISPEEKQQSTAFETIYDLETIECDLHASYASQYTSPILAYLKGKSSIETYLKTLQNR